MCSLINQCHLESLCFLSTFFFKSTNVVHIIYGKVFNLNQILNSFQNCDVGCYIWNQINSIKFTFNQSPRSIFPQKTNFNSTVAKVLHITLICSSIMSAWGKRVFSQTFPPTYYLFSTTFPPK